MKDEAEPGEWAAKLEPAWTSAGAAAHERVLTPVRAAAEQQVVVLRRIAKKTLVFDVRKTMRRLQAAQKSLEDTSAPESVQEGRRVLVARLQDDLDEAKVLDPEALAAAVSPQLQKAVPDYIELFSTTETPSNLSFSVGRTQRRVLAHRQMTETLAQSQKKIALALVQACLEHQIAADAAQAELARQWPSLSKRALRPAPVKPAAERPAAERPAKREFDEVLNAIERTNRPGQRARRKQWELKFGDAAKHLVAAVEKPRRGRDGSAPVSKAERAADAAAAHPSWEAARRRKEQERQVQAAAGATRQRIVFSDSE